MKLDNVFKKTRLASGRKGYISLNSARPEVPEGLLRKCNKCGSAIIAKDVMLTSAPSAEDISVYTHTAGLRWWQTRIHSRNGMLS